jgi:5'-phosphate synthase pdxT subunit
LTEAAPREMSPQKIAPPGTAQPGISQPKIGVLAIQGDYASHAAALKETGAEPSLVKTAQTLKDADGQWLDGLILPGGESTTMLKFLLRDGFLDELRAFAQVKPVFGTCAGAILLAKEVRNPSQASLDVLDIAVERNAYGAQRDSAILKLETMLPEWQQSGLLEAVFIRAPRIVAAGPQIEVLAERDGFPVLVREKGPAGKAMAAMFHPELSSDRRVHQLFTDLVASRRNLPIKG